MAILTDEDFANAKRDINDIGESVNIEKIITPRFGNPYKSLPLAIKEVIETGGFEPFKTEAELLLSVPLLEKKAAKALDTKKIWLWENGTWVDTGLSDSDLSNKYTRNLVERIFERGINIFDPSLVKNGFYVNYLTGDEGGVAGYSALGPYRIEGGVTYKTPYDYDKQGAYYDENLVYISGFLKPNQEAKLTTPPNAYYIKLSILTEQIPTFMLSKASEYPSTYTPFVLTKSNLQINTDQVKNLMDDVKNDIGIYPINLINTNKVKNGFYVNYLTGDEGAVSRYSILGPYEIKSGTEYQFSEFYDQQGVFLDSNSVYISGFASPINHKITSPSNAKYIKLSILTPQISLLVFSESSVFPSSYVSNSAIRIPNLVLDSKDDKPIEIYTSSDENHPTAEFKGKNAIQRALDSIADASAKKRYQIIDSSVYKIANAVDYIGQRGYPSAILAKDHVDIIGNGNTVVYAELPYNDAEIGMSVDGNTYPRNMYQTLYAYAEDSLIKGITFVAKNTRYALHLDNANGANKTHRFEDVNFIFKGDKGSVQAIGMGTSTGEEVYFNGGYCHSDFGIPFYLHNNINFKKSSLVSFKGYKFSSNASTNAMLLQSNGSLAKDRIEMIGCSFGGSAYVVYYWQNWLSGNTANNNDSFDHAEWEFTGYGNEPFLFDNVVGGDCLRFKTTTAGVNSSIRFDKTSSAFNILIKNTKTESIANFYLNGRDDIDGYIAQDGSIDLPAYAFGCKDLSESIYALDGGVNYTGMGKRLGDCSSANKSMGVVINGATSTVTFNKNYTGMTNSQIVSEINTQLSGAAAELYAYGRDYYPMMPDVAELVFNTTSAPILKGSVVTKSGGSVRLANGNDKVFGVALDDIPVMSTSLEGVNKGQGRVMKRGYIYANPSKSHFVKANVHVPSVGTRFKVVNGELVDDFVSGTISVNIDTGVVSINC